MRSSLIDTRCTAAARGNFQTTLAELLRHSIIIKTSKNGLLRFIFGDTDVPSTASTLPRDQGPEYDLNPLETVGIV